VCNCVGFCMTGWVCVGYATYAWLCMYNSCISHVFLMYFWEHGIHEKYMWNTCIIHEKYIDFSLLKIKYMRNTWEIHVFYVFLMYFSCIAHVFLMYLTCILQNSCISHVFQNVVKTGENRSNTWEIHEKYIDFPVLNPIFNVFPMYRSEKSMYFKTPTNIRKTHVFLMYFSCISHVSLKNYKKRSEKSMYISCISHVFSMYFWTP